MNLASIKADYKIKINLHRRLKREINMLWKAENVISLNCSILLCLMKHMF